MWHRTFYDRTTRRVRDTDVAGWRIYLAFEQGRVACSRCQGVKVERLDWLAQNPRYTQRFAYQVGTLCRDMSNRAVAQLLHLHEHTVKDLDMRYMRAWLAKTPQLAPQVIGVDELSIKKGHTYRIVVSDLERGRPIWVGGQGRTAADLDRFFLDLGPKKTARIRLAVMARWQAFRNSVQAHAPQTQILFDKFHILRHLADAMDQVRRAEYKRVAAKDRAFIKGQRYTLLSTVPISHWPAAARFGSCCGPTSAWPPPTCSRRSSGNSGPTVVKGGRASSSPVGKSNSSGNGSGRLRNLPP